MFPKLSTNRFLLQEILPGDQPFIFEGLSNPEVIPFYGVQYGSLESTSAQMDFYSNLWKEKTGCWWKVVEKKTNDPVGAVGMNAYNAVHEKAEIGYWLLPAHWKKGVMSEVWPVLLDHLFSEWKLHRLEAVVEVGNIPSARLSQKLGFTFEGTHRETEIKNGERISLWMYGLLASEWKKKEKGERGRE
jgi:ribosomal-protein-alanine N-acetyltransferase